jgi:hypothetical protein
MISHIKEIFQLGTINVYTNNSTDVKRDDELVEWFIKNIVI